MLESLVELDVLAEQVQVAGLIRFSYPCDGGFQQKYASRQAKLQSLYSAKRMQARFELFETICLHSLQRQSVKNFTFGILVGEDMPRQYRQKLDDMLAGIPQARVIALPYMQYRDGVRQAFEQLFDQDKEFRISFRLDDDDAVATDYIEQTIRLVPQLMMLSEGMQPVALSFNRSLTLAGAQGARYLFAGVDAPCPSVGLSVFAPQKWRRNVLLHAHEKIHYFMRTMIEPRPMMILRSWHDSNDSRCRYFGVKRALENSEIAAVLRDRFDMDMARLLAL